MVSLYHTLVSAIGEEFPVSHLLAGRILNLPVHQDVDDDDIVGGARLLAEVLGLRGVDVQS